MREAELAGTMPEQKVIRIIRRKTEDSDDDRHSGEKMLQELQRLGVSPTILESLRLAQRNAKQMQIGTHALRKKSMPSDEKYAIR